MAKQSSTNMMGNFNVEGSNLTMVALAAPTGLNATVAGTSFYYVVTSLNPAGVETTASSEVSSGSGTTISWTAVTGAQSYRLYRGTTSGGEAGYVATTTNSVTNADTASLTGNSTPPTNTIGSGIVVNAWSGQTSGASSYPFKVYNQAGSLSFYTNGFGNTVAVQGMQAQGQLGSGATLSSSYVLPGTNVRGVLIVAPNTITTANMLEVQNSSNSPVAYIDRNGNITSVASHTGATVVSSGLTGATAASRYVGATASGAPASGTFVVGDFVIDQTGKVWICTTGGSPGTWTAIAGGTGTVTSVTAADTSVVVGGTGAAPTLATGSLDVIATDHPPAADWSNNSKAITNISNVAVSGTTGATASSRYVGATASGAPASGTFALGDYIVDQTGLIWICVSAGTPGSWVSIGTQDQLAFTAPDFNFLAWNWDPMLWGTGGSTSPTSGTIYLNRINIRVPTSCTNVVLYIQTAGSGLTSGQNFAGLYNSAGTLVGTTADQTTSWGSATGTQIIPLSGGPYALSSGFYWVAIVSNGTTPPAFTRANSTGGGVANLNLSVQTMRWGTNGIGTSLPSSITPASNVRGGVEYWVALS